MTKELKPRIVVIGVGGAGGNAVDNMIEANLRGVEFYVANTDAQAMLRSKTENRVQLGLETTGGLGAGARPEVGAAAAEESMDEINAILDDVHMVFVAAGMGGGTGTGAAPVIAKAAHDRGILTIGVVTKPFGFEGTHRMSTAEAGLEKIKDVVDTLIVVPNQNLFRIANERTTFAEAFRMADDVLYCGVRGITDLMIMPGLINLDFADVRTIMKGMGTAMMGMGEGEGEGRALEAARAAIDNPLLDDVSLRGAKGVLINITGGYDLTLFELDEAANEIRREVDDDANIILGSTFDPDLEGRIQVSVVAAGLSKALQAAAPEPKSTAQPTIVTPSPVSEPMPEPAPVVAEADPRPDFDGRTLPAAHTELVEGEDRVSADAVFGSRPKADGPAGFSNLFGWRRDEATGDNDSAPEAEKIVTTPDDHPTAAPFDDEDLEIPAFLRRSANN
ncbi:MAG: cell division protein FtsZ [Henriciella sp.]|nr:cell division protein FtsZ [Henriciella sp.]